MAQTKAQKKRAIEGKKGHWVNSNPFDLRSDMVFVEDKDYKITPPPKTCQSCGGSGQIFRNRSEMESGEGVKCKKCRGYGY